ncbi:MAG TPA: halogenase, partial [Rhodanobacteraceae bacterium]|nr:halogenase [Rhodanobacteraceae bacterium]
FYWGVLCQLVFQDRLTDTALLGNLRSELDQAQQLNRRMQLFFRAWHLESRGRDDAVMLDQRDLGWFVAMNRSLHDVLTTDQLADRLRENVALMHRLAGTIGRRASRLCPRLDARAIGGDGTAAGPQLFNLAA